MSESPLRYAARLLARHVDSDQTQWVLAQLARTAARYGDCADALSLLPAITFLEQRFAALEDMVRHCKDARGSVKELRESLPRLDPQSALAREEPDTLFAVCLDAGLFDDALEICELYDDSYTQCSALARLAGRMVRSGSSGKGPELLLRSSHLLPAVANEDDRDSILSDIGCVYAACGMAVEWRDALDSIQLPEYRMEPLAAMAATDPSFLAELVRAGCSIGNSPDGAQRLWSLNEPIRVCLAIGKIDEALQLVRSMPEGSRRDWGHLEICAASIRAHQLDRSRQIASGIESPWFQLRALTLLGAAWLQAGDLESASQLLRTAADRVPDTGVAAEQIPLSAAQWTIELGALLARYGLEEQASRLLHRVERDRRIPVNSKIEAFLDCASRAVSEDSAFAREALESAFRIAERDGPYGAHWLARIAAQYQRMFDPASAQAVLERAFSQAPAKLQMLWMVAEAYREAGQRFSADLEQFLASIVSEEGTP